MIEAGIHNGDYVFVRKQLTADELAYMRTFSEEIRAELRGGPVS